MKKKILYPVKVNKLKSKLNALEDDIAYFEMLKVWIENKILDRKIKQTELKLTLKQQEKI